jgi:hypothetical protein
MVTLDIDMPIVDLVVLKETICLATTPSGCLAEVKISDHMDSNPKKMVAITSGWWF